MQPPGGGGGGWQQAPPQQVRERARRARGAERDAFDGCASLASTVRARVDAFDARATSVTG